MSVWSTFWVLFVPAHPVPSDVYSTLINLWTVCQVTAFHLVCPICSHQWCNSLKFKNPMGKQNWKWACFYFWFYTLRRVVSVQNLQYVLYLLCWKNIEVKNKVQGWFWAEQICLTLPTQHQLGLFPQLTASFVYVWVWSGHLSKGSVSAGWILWFSVQHNKEIVTSHSFSLQHPSPNKHITSTAGGGGQQHSCQPPLFFLPSSGTSQVHSAAGHLRHEQVLCWWSWAWFWACLWAC